MLQIPRIAVLIPAYNAEKTIVKALDSLKANSEPHDIIVVDDGSALPLKKLLKPEDNLVILRADRNLGVAAAANIGLRYILDRDYEFVARLDADDAATPDRLAVQRAFMHEHPDVALVGGWGRVVSEIGKTVFYLNYPTGHDDIVKGSFYNHQFIHSTLMIRTETLREVGLYNEQTYPNYSDDHELTSRIARYAKVANMPLYLVDYTLSPQGISLSKRGRQLRARLVVQYKYRDFGNIHFYLGICKTLVLMLLPYRLVTAIKKRKKEYRKR